MENADQGVGGHSYLGEKTSMAARRLRPTIDQRFSRFPLLIRRSRIHGYGVFAAGTIQRGRKVIEYMGKRLNVRRARARFKEIWGPGGAKLDCLFRLNRYWSVDGSSGGNGAERINHSCEPNLKARVVRGHILYFSRRRILPGEELTVDYRFSPNAGRVICRCGSPSCRGTINAAPNVRKR